MDNQWDLEQKIQKGLAEKDKRKKRKIKMKVSGKSVFGLKQIIIQKNKKAKKV